MQKLLFILLPLRGLFSLFSFCDHVLAVSFVAGQRLLSALPLLPQMLDNRLAIMEQAFDIGRIARPQFTTDRQLLAQKSHRAVQMMQLQ